MTRTFKDFPGWINKSSDSDEECVKRSGLFDADWYLTKYPDIALAKIDPLEHYLKQGAFEGYSPSPHFDSQWYLSQYPETAKINPLVHYIRHGKSEGHLPLPPPCAEEVLAQTSDKSLLNPKGEIENVILNSGILKLKGWGLLENRIVKIEVYLNDVLLDPTQGAVFYGKERPDLEKVNPLFKGILRSGFEALYHLDPIPGPIDGLYTVKVRIFDNEGQYGELTESFREAPPGILTTPENIAMWIDLFQYSASGTIFIVGWIDDRKIPFKSLTLFTGNNEAMKITAFSRVKRPDVEAALNCKSRYLLGFWSVVTFEPNMPIGNSCVICGQLADGSFWQKEVKSQLMSDIDLRDSILLHLANIDYHFGNRIMENFLALDTGIGSKLIELNRRITASIVAEPWVSYYGPQRENYSGSIIVCLLGKKDFLFLQSSLFSAAEGSEDYEFIFVSNSPELTQSLEKEVQICAHIYGVSITLVCLPNNAGFGAANNVAASFARSNRLIFTNPDVFPRDNDWPRRHSHIIETYPKDQILIFGAPLYYDDGSLMHNGIYFMVEPGLVVGPKGISSYPFIYTEHYAKGLPSWSKQYDCPRPVPAITGAFISIDRDWFESLGGFNEDYVFGHYEDVDLCLKSLAEGKPVWIHDFPLWHLEGQGSIRQKNHEGASLVNQWLFTQQWGDWIIKEIEGPKPTCPQLQKPSGPNFEGETDGSRGAA